MTPAPADRPGPSGAPATPPREPVVGPPGRDTDGRWPVDLPTAGDTTESWAEAAEAAEAHAHATQVGRRAAASTGAILFARMISLVVVLIGSILLARRLGPAARGVHAFVVALVIALGTVTMLGNQVGAYTLVTRQGIDRRRLGGNAPYVALLAGIMAALIISIPAVNDAFPDGVTAIPLWPLPLIIGAAGYVLNSQFILLTLAAGRPLLGALVSFGPYTIAALVYILALPFTPDPSASPIRLGVAVWAFAISLYLACGLVTIPRLKVGVAAVARPSFALFRKTLGQGIRNYPADLASILHQRVDVLLLGVLATATSLGIYVVAYQVVEPILTFASASASTILALEHTVSSEEREGQVTAALVRQLLVIGPLLGIAGALVLPSLVPLLFGEAFRSSIQPLLLLLPGVIALAVGRSASAYLVSRNRLATNAAIGIAALCINVPLNLALIPPLRATGAAIASLTSYTAYMLMSLAAFLVVSHSGIRAIVPGRHEVALVPWAARAAVRRARRWGARARPGRTP